MINCILYNRSCSNWASAVLLFLMIKSRDYWGYVLVNVVHIPLYWPYIYLLLRLVPKWKLGILKKPSFSKLWSTKSKTAVNTQLVSGLKILLTWTFLYTSLYLLLSVFDDGDITTLRRTSLCLKSGRHFAESETLDQLPLTHPEHFGTPVLGGRRGGRRR